MEVRKPVLELKDVPPPPLHSASQQPLALAPKPVPPPCQLPSDPQLPQQPLSQLQPGSPKVSLCSRCECSLHVQQHSGSFEARAHSLGDGFGGGCSISSSVNPSTGGGGRPALFSPTQLQTPQSFGFRVASVATSQPMAAHTHPSCCGHLHTFSPVSAGRLQSNHGPCVALPGCCRCSEEHRVEQHYHSHSDTQSSTHLCTNPLYLEHNTVCQQGAHYCHQCLRKVGFSPAAQLYTF